MNLSFAEASSTLSFKLGYYTRFHSADPWRFFQSSEEINKRLPTDGSFRVTLAILGMLYAHKQDPTGPHYPTCQMWGPVNGNVRTYASNPEGEFIWTGPRCIAKNFKTAQSMLSNLETHS